jgi:TonB family protein
MLSEPEIAPPEEDVERVVEADEGPATDEEGAPSIDGDARTIGLAELPEPDSLSFDRLSALRPELAFMTASAWVLLRNQTEVEAFLRRGYRSGRLDPDAAGSVSVTLWIDRRGSVEWAEVSQSSGRNDLDEFTLALFNEVAAFRAAREQGVYVSRSVTFSVNYPW